MTLLTDCAAHLHYVSRRCGEASRSEVRNSDGEKDARRRKEYETKSIVHGKESIEDSRDDNQDVVCGFSRLRSERRGWGRLERLAGWK